jgi:hypothetical protein
LLRNTHERSRYSFFVSINPIVEVDVDLEQLPQLASAPPERPEHQDADDRSGDGAEGRENVPALQVPGHGEDRQQEPHTSRDRRKTLHHPARAKPGPLDEIHPDFAA